MSGGFGRVAVSWGAALAGAALAAGLVGCGQPQVIVVQDDGGQGTTTDSGATQSDAQAGTQGGTTAGTEAIGDAEAQAAEVELVRELDEFARGETDELDTAVIESLDDMGYLSPVVSAEWVEGFSYEIGEPTATGATQLSFPVSVTVRQIGPTIAAGDTPQSIAKKVAALQPQTTTVEVLMQREADGDWEITPEGEQALTGALVGPMAR